MFMCCPSRGEKIALIVLALALVSVIAVVWAVNYQTSVSEDQQTAYLGILTLVDTVPQWLMAIFSIVATILSAWAVVLLKETLHATREAVRAADDTVAEQRRIGEAQTRAYISVKDVDLTVGIQQYTGEPVCVVVRIILGNTGETPATCTTWGWIIKPYSRTVPEEEPEIIHEFTEDLPHLYVRGEGELVELPLTTLPLEAIEAARLGRCRLFSLGYMKYRDVFYPDSPELIFTFCVEICPKMPVSEYKNFKSTRLPPDAFEVRHYPKYEIKISGNSQMNSKDVVRA